MSTGPIRRAKGGGSIRQRTKGSWQIRYEGPPGENGRPTKLSETVRGSRRDAERVLRERLGMVESSAYVPKNTETVAEYLWRWMDTYAATNTTARTQQGYRVNIKRVAPMIGAIKLQGLQPAHMQKMYADLLERGLSAQTVLHTHRVLREALNHAVKWGVLIRNPADAVDPPRPEAKELQTWDGETIHAFLRAAKQGPFSDIYNLAVLTGMRRAELCGLRWERVDLDVARLSVAATLQRIVGKGLVQGQPKTGRSRRVIALSESALKLLRDVRSRQIEHRLKAGPAWQETGYVFTQEDGSPIDADRVSRDFARIVREASLPYMTLHGLRHTHATMLFSQGIHPKVVSERLGHSNIAITLDTYSHVLPDMQEAAAQAIDERLANQAQG